MKTHYNVNEKNVFKKVLIVLITCILSSFVFSFVFYLMAPEEIVAHWSASGIPDRIGKRSELFLMPGFLSITHLLFLLLWKYLIFRTTRLKLGNKKSRIKIIYWSAIIVAGIFLSLSIIMNYCTLSMTLEQRILASVIVGTVVSVFSCLFMFSFHPCLGLLPLLSIGTINFTRFINPLVWTTIVIIYVCVLFLVIKRGKRNEKQ